MEIDLTLDDLPKDPDKLARLTLNYAKECVWLREQLRLLQVQLYGRKSEQFPIQNANQLPLFSTEPPPSADEQKTEQPTKEVEVSAHTRKRSTGRKPLPAFLPRVEKIYDLSEDEKKCCCGAVKCRIGEEVSEQLEHVPASMYVIRNVRPKYACRKFEGLEDEGPTVTIAPAPPQMIPKSIAGPGLLAHVLTAKFVDGTPFYRQESQFARITVEIKRATMCNWAMKVAEACAPLIELLREEVIAGQLVNCDETRLQVLDEPGRAATDESYMWVFVGGPAGRKAVLFEYSPSRGSDVPLRILKGYHGAVQCDGYVAYDCLVPLLGVTLYGCWAHARRKFVNILKALEKLKPAHQGGGIAQEAVDRIRLFYAIDASARKENLTVEDTLTLRQRDTKPKFESMKTWLEGLKDEVPPRGLLGQAIRYALGEWPRLERIADTGFVPLDNNVAENAIRPFVIGRKNWLFAGTPEGAKASATLYSLIETAKANGLEPFQYLRTLFEHLPTATTVDQYRLLLPQYLERDLLVTPKQPVLRIPSPYG